MCRPSTSLRKKECVQPRLDHIQTTQLWSENYRLFENLKILRKNRGLIINFACYHVILSAIGAQTAGQYIRWDIHRHGHTIVVMKN